MDCDITLAISATNNLVFISYVAIGGIVKALEDTLYILTQLLAIKHYLEPLFK